MWIVSPARTTRQSNESRRAADAAAESANAAYGSVTFAEAQWDLAREKERARLDLDAQRVSMEIESEGTTLRHLIATLKMRNIGASRAFIRRSHGVLITKAPDAGLEESGDVPLSLPDHFLDPSTSAIEVPVYLFPHETDIQSFAESLEQSKCSLYLFGFIEYETLGLHWRREFEYEWLSLALSPLGALMGMDDPPDQSPKDRILYGYWSPSQRDRPEYPISSEQPKNQN